MTKKVLIIAHPQLIPELKMSSPDRFKTPWVTEYDVATALLKKGYQVEFIGIDYSLIPLLEKIKAYNPDYCFNLLEQFNDNAKLESNIAAVLELHNIKFTGNGSKGLMLARDKALTKKILKFHKLPTPSFFTIPKKKKRKVPKLFKYPLIAKCLFEEASLGIAQASIVTSEHRLIERLNYIHNSLGEDAIIEEFIEGKEIYVGVSGTTQLKVYEPWELFFDNVKNPNKEIYTQQAKWNKAYRDRKGIRSGKAIISGSLKIKIQKICRKAYQVLQFEGYARFDLRVSKDESIYIIEANPNPNLAMDDEFALSAKSDGIPYEDFIEKILKIN